MAGVIGPARHGRRIAEQAAAFVSPGHRGVGTGLIAATLVVGVISATMQRTLR